MLAKQKAVNNINQLKGRLSSILKNLEVIPVSTLDDRGAFSSNETPIGKLCEKYYQERMGDDHTGSVKFGYKECGLTVVLHHNTPNNSIYPLWNRLAIKEVNDQSAFNPLFSRIERHRSTK